MDASRRGSRQMLQSSSAPKFPQVRQRFTRSWSLLRASPRPEASSGGDSSTKNASRVAVRSPMPGRRAKSATSSPMGSPAMIDSAEAGDLEAAGDLLDLGVDGLARLGERGVGGGHHEILRHLQAFFFDELRVDLEGDELEGAVDLGLHAIVARAGLELFGLELLAARLDLALHPRRLPHELVHSTAKTHDLSCSLAFEGDLDVAFGLGEYIERVEDARVFE